MQVEAETVDGDEFIIIGLAIFCWGIILFWFS